MLIKHRGQFAVLDYRPAACYRNGKRPITTDFALLIEAALQIKASIFVNMQTDYDLQTASQDARVSLRLEHIRNVCASLF